MAENVNGSTDHKHCTLADSFNSLQQCSENNDSPTVKVGETPRDAWRCAENPNFSYGPSSRYQKSVKRNPSGPHHFPVHRPYQQPGMPHDFNVRVPTPYMPVPFYAYQFGPPQPFMDVESHVSVYVFERPRVQPFVPNVYIPTLHELYPGPANIPHPPHFVQFPLNTGAPMPSRELQSLRANIVRQIEYYFSDENLLTDHYLKSRMDDQGWVPVSLVANFNRVKGMTTDISLVLDALRSSTTVELQDVYFSFLSLIVPSVFVLQMDYNTVTKIYLIC